MAIADAGGERGDDFGETGDLTLVATVEPAQLAAADDHRPGAVVFRLQRPVRYVAGSPRLMRAVLFRLLEAGVPFAQLHYDVTLI